MGRPREGRALSEPATGGRAASKGAQMARPGRFDAALFAALRVAVRTSFRAWFRLAVEGPPPPPGPCVFAANHTSFLDPLLLGAAAPSRLVYLMTEVVWRSPRLGWFYRWNQAIPLSVRGGNRQALRAARDVLQQGRSIGIFPEGGISRDGLPMLGSPGAVSLVLHAGVPIVPVGIVGAQAALPPGASVPRPVRIVVRFGEPILPARIDALGGGDRRERLRLATLEIMRSIATLTGHSAREDERNAPR